MSTTLFDPHIQTALDRLHADQADPVTPDLGALLYQLVRASRSQTVVKCCASVAATVYMAAALQDNGGGRLISSEPAATRAEHCRQALELAGLAHLVDIRVGDAQRTLAADPPSGIGMLLLDGQKCPGLPLLRQLEARLLPGALVAAGSGAAADDGLLDYVQDSDNGYASSALFTQAGGGLRAAHVAVRL